MNQSTTNQDSQGEIPEVLKKNNEEENNNNGVQENEKETLPVAPQTPTKESKLEEISPAIMTTSGKKRPPYRYDPDKITLRFIFANRDGLAVHLECKPADTIGEVKGALLSVWPNELPNCSGGDKLRLICMGKGMLMPDSRSLEDCQVPVFKTHPTPVNVSVKPENILSASEKPSRSANSNQSLSGLNNSSTRAHTVSQGCACSIL
mmetsp:Transcript_41593/g.47271  ORF Transcript_41593/g.47271 Transcript_41593/m.47271 type:complete len:206 (-) Transcript_41593:142-759(-)|eukprot:CAMPEP_0194146534 /NCGR_PEP_ID=MMETSP0152-20130528/20799_1 /TAXON_ID=1049557 /ORGANISM="Thalassiothrix antarctica, Strain L6-D1" /LENGTH=205 /DNA_ID=CAMNT_0038847075 /DNA_START=249 /DNA_END=866 /DNA_ORIENTATION=+